MLVFALSLLWILPGALGKDRRGAVDEPWHPRVSAAIPSALTADSAICPASETLVFGLDSSRTPRAQKGICRKSLKGHLFCTYTRQDFNGGEGISLITTAEAFADIAKLPVFGVASDPKTPVEPPRHRSVPYEEVEIPGKGIGVVATRVIRFGTLIMADTPAVMIDARAIDHTAAKLLKELVTDAIGHMPAEHRRRYYDLTTHDAVGSEKDRAIQIFATNAYKTKLDIDKLSDFHSAFVGISRINHDCRSNSGYYFDPETLEQRVFAATDIMPGEEITVSYADVLQTREERRDYLHKNWGFNCTCQRCGAEAHVAAESDERVRHIQRLWRELDDYSGGGAGSPEKAELLVALYEMEGVAGRLHEAYYRAALEWNGVGGDVQAARYARMCLDRGLRLRGPGKAFQESMKTLLQNATGHWSWRFRLKEPESP